MGTWCLTKQMADKFRVALKSGAINPFKMADMTSAERRAFIAKYVGETNAKQVNSLFESKLLLKNQKRGYITWAKHISGITPKTRRDILSRIEKMDRVLDPKEGEQFLQDLASSRLRVDVTQEEAKTISDMSSKVVETRDSWQAEIDKNPKWSDDPVNTYNQWKNNSTRLKYGSSKVAIEKYIRELKIQSKKIFFRKQPILAIIEGAKAIPGAAKSLVASIDNSFFGKQGISALLDYKTSHIWIKNFLKSWVDIGKTLVGYDTMDALKADIYSRPNAMNGKYEAGDYGLNVLAEEVFPSSLPEKIPLLGKFFKASESAFNGGALRMRADLADRFIPIAESQGVNVLSKEEAKYLGGTITTITGRTNLGRAEPISGPINVVLFSIKFATSRINILLSPIRFGSEKLAEKAGVFKFKNKGQEVAHKESATHTMRVVASLAVLFGVGKLLSPDSVELEPRNTNFGKIKIFGRWTDVTGGLAPYLRLAARLAPTYRDGKWSSWRQSSTGKWTDLRAGEYGQQNGWDELINAIFSNKLSPVASIFRDTWRGEHFGGERVSLKSTIIQAVTPISIQSFDDFNKDPASEFVLGSVILEGIGLSTNSYPEPNEQSELIPVDEKIKNSSLIDVVTLYANAVKTDPETAFNRFFTGQRIRKIDNNTIIVERIPLEKSQAIKKKADADKPTMKLDHTIPLQLGGSNSRDNLKIVTTSEHRSYTPVENALGRALKAKKITKKEAQSLITRFKKGKITKKQVLNKIK